ncbi:MAG: hypothetical protein Q7S06_03230 [Nanoarchaeota archaeon]|nr:hypothetical protein [Nanoarchaeota archaeon]
MGEIEARDYEEQAKRLLPKIESLEGKRAKFSHHSWEETYFEKLGRLQNQVADLYKEAAREYGKSKKPRERNKALASYESALEHGWGKERREQIESEIEKLSQQEPKTFKILGRKGIFVTLSIVFLIGSLFFISFSLTGNAIVDLSSDNLTLVGIGLFILGLVFAFFYIQEKKR